jgi:KTSC domain
MQDDPPLEEKSFRTSSVIRRVAYDEGTEELTIWFVSGNVYRYYRVPVSVWDGLATAKSAGTYFNQHITGRYRFEEIDPSGPQGKGTRKVTKRTR